MWVTFKGKKNNFQEPWTLISRLVISNSIGTLILKFPYAHYRIEQMNTYFGILRNKCSHWEKKEHINMVMEGEEKPCGEC